MYRHLRDIYLWTAFFTFTHEIRLDEMFCSEKCHAVIVALFNPLNKKWQHLTP